MRTTGKTQVGATSKDPSIIDLLYWNEGPEELYHAINHHELVVALPIAWRFLIAVLAAAIRINIGIRGTACFTQWRFESGSEY